MAGIVITQSSGLNDSFFGKSQAPIRSFIEHKAEAWEQESSYDKIFNVQTSTNYAEKITSATEMDDFLPVGELGSYPLTSLQEGYSKILEHVTWKNKFIISQEMVEDNKLLDIQRKAYKFVNAYYRTRERFGAGLLYSAIADTEVTFGDKKFSTLAADGQRLFYNAHPNLVAGGTQCNLFSNTFDADNLGLVATAMQNFRGENGELLALSPDTIIIPNDAKLKADVFAVVGSDKDPDTGNNRFNYQYGMWNIIISPYLNEWDTSGKKPWFLMDSKYNQMNQTCVWLDRIPLNVNSEIDPDTDGNIWKGRSRFTAGFNDWRGIVCAGISGATTLS